MPLELEGITMVSVNGKMHDTRAGQTLLELLHELGYRLEVIAVELNGQVLTRGCYGDTVLHEGDSLEVVSFVGGG